MKKYMVTAIAVFVIFALTACATTGSKSETVSLDNAIENAAVQIGDGLENGTKVAVLNFTSPAEGLSNYAADELSAALAKNKKITVVERKELGLIRGELQFQLSGEVSDESAQAIGKMLGAQTVITGTLVNVGKSYRLRIKAINVEKAFLETTVTLNVNANDKQLVFLLDQKGQPIEREYEIGETGQAGGIVFYDKGVYEDGWRYLEVATRDLEAPFGLLNYDFSSFEALQGYATGSSGLLGAGKEDAQILLSMLQKAGEKRTAVQVCAAYKQGGYSDWFLPSFWELLVIRNEIWEKRGLGNFKPYVYISSSPTWTFKDISGKREYVSCAMGFYFDKANNDIQYILRDVPVSIRPIRAF